MGHNLGGRNHKNCQEIDNLVCLTKNWLYSMMKDVETVEEYQ
jgi:hypothetical protein